MTRDEFFQELYKRPPTEEEIARFSRFGDVLNLAKEDSMWYIILVNEFYDNRHVERLQDVERVAKGAVCPERDQRSGKGKSRRDRRHQKQRVPLAFVGFYDKRFGAALRSMSERWIRYGKRPISLLAVASTKRL